MGTADESGRIVGRTVNKRKPKTFPDTFPSQLPERTSVQQNTSANMKISVFLLAILLIAVFSLLSAIFMYFLWNWLMPDIFGLKVITYWQAWGLCFLCEMLFKSSSSSKDS